MTSKYSTEENLVFLSNGYTSALENNGSIVWFPCVRFDSPSIFTKILDKDVGGEFAVYPNSEYKLSTTYLENSLIVRNLFQTPKGKLELTDFLLHGAPTVIRIFNSDIDFLLDIKPKFYYGKVEAVVETKKYGVVFKNPRAKSAFEVFINGDYKVLDDGKIKLSAGKGYVAGSYTKNLKYSMMQSDFDPKEVHIDKAFRTTLDYWNMQVGYAKKVNQFKEAYYRSIAVTIGLMYEQSGAILAAPTTSLPEIEGEGWNWDYRYNWIRDASYAAGTLSKIGLERRAKHILNFMFSVLDQLRGNFAHPLYTVDGTEAPEEMHLEWLSGYKNSKPVRVGNEAYIQTQRDTTGAFLDALLSYLSASKNNSFLNENWDAIEALANETEKNWRMKCTSIWEERDEPRHYVHSKVTQWVALERASRIAKIFGKDEEAKEWMEAAKKIKEDVLRNGFSKKVNSFVKYYGSEDVDGALLLLPLYDFIEAGDPKFISTLEKIHNDLEVEEGLLLRDKYRTIGSATHEEKNPFLLLSTWLARIYIRLGEKEKARRVIEKLITCGTANLLFAENFDRKAGQVRGNFPQLFPHTGLIEAISEYNRLKS